VKRTKRLLLVLVGAALACGGPTKRPPSLPPQALATLRDLVFADQDLNEVVALQKAVPDDNPNSPWPGLATAARLRDEDPEAATAELEEVLALPGLETRVQLWTWTALRGLGALPDDDSADVVQGVVIEMPVDGGLDTLAVFRDGTMRYFNHAGKAAFWDGRPGAAGSATADLVRRPIALAEQVKVADRGPIIEERTPSRPGWLRVSFLAFGGIRQREAPADAVRDDDPLVPFVTAGAAIIQKAAEGARAR
jgi:hypothetical protein